MNNSEWLMKYVENYQIGHITYAIVSSREAYAVFEVGFLDNGDFRIEEPVFNGTHSDCRNWIADANCTYMESLE